MKTKWLYVITLFLCGMFAFLTTEASNNKSVAGTRSSMVIKFPASNSQKQHAGDSPFIRFHHGIYESSVSVSSQSQSIIPLKPVNSIPEKFVGITTYVSSLFYILPVTRVFLYSLPLRSPPLLAVSH